MQFDANFNIAFFHLLHSRLERQAYGVNSPLVIRTRLKQSKGGPSYMALVNHETSTRTVALQLSRNDAGVKVSADWIAESDAGNGERIPGGNGKSLDYHYGSQIFADHMNGMASVFADAIIEFLVFCKDPLPTSH